MVALIVLHEIYKALRWTWASTTGYNVVSGDVANLGLIAAVIVFVRHRNCHVKGCWHFGHTDPEHGYPACRTHHSKADLIGHA